MILHKALHFLLHMILIWKTFIHKKVYISNNTNEFIRKNNFKNFYFTFLENFIGSKNQNSNLTSQEIYNLNLNIEHQKYQVRKNSNNAEF